MLIKDYFDDVNIGRKKYTFTDEFHAGLSVFNRTVYILLCATYDTPVLCFKNEKMSVMHIVTLPIHALIMLPPK